MTMTVLTKELASDEKIICLIRESIEEILSHRSPESLLIDKAEIHMKKDEKGLMHKTIVGTKLVRGDEPFLRGHFNKFALMPGVIMGEGLAQCGEVLACFIIPPEKLAGRIPMLRRLEIDFWHWIRPNDIIEYHVEIISNSIMRAKMKGEILLNNETACRAEFIGKLVTIPID